MFAPLARVLLIKDNSSDAQLLQQQLTQISLQRLDIIHVESLMAVIRRPIPGWREIKLPVCKLQVSG